MTEEKMRELSKAFSAIEDLDMDCEMEIPWFEIVRNTIVVFGTDHPTKPAEWDEERV